MVANIGKGKDLYSVLAYNMVKVDTEQATVLTTNNMIEPESGKYNISLCLRSFEPLLTANKKTEKPIIHISLNPHPDDKVDDTLFTDMASEYMAKMGWENQPYIVFKHQDIDRTHIHIVTVNINENGKQINNYNDYKLSKQATKELEKKYNLVPADRLTTINRLPLKPVNARDGNVKKQIAGITHTLINSYSFQSIAQYKALLSLYNVTVEEVKGEVRGKLYNGLVYSALNKKGGNKIGHPYKASSISRNVGYEALQKKFKTSKSKAKEKSIYNTSKEKISRVLAKNPKRKNFEKELLKQGISVVFRENEDKRIYGVTFIDHNSKLVFNGSVLGKEYSANSFENLFNPKEDNTNFNHPDYSNRESIAENIAGLFSFDDNGTDPEEEAFTNRMKRKKRKPKRPKL